MKDWEKIYQEKCKNFKELPSILPPVKRIIVIGDLHGDWKMTIESLKIGKVINEKNQWIGKDTVVVQVGDQIDRCRSSGIACHLPNATKDDEASDMRILNFFTSLHQEAEKVGGAVYSIIGNHELMNVKGDMRYVSHDNVRDFDNYETTEGKIINNGMEARKWAFTPGNPIANFLGCTRKLALIIGSNLFVHAGILPEIAEKYGINDMNKILSRYLWDKLKNEDDYKDLLDSSAHSPLWNRVFGETTKSTQSCNSLMSPLKEIYKVDKMFIGHNPQIETGITNICDKKVWLTDYGASNAFNNYDISYSENNERSKVRNAQVLEIIDDGVEINILK
jgi:hypothetical protein